MGFRGGVLLGFRQFGGVWGVCGLREGSRAWWIEILDWGFVMAARMMVLLRVMEG